ncbi:hypothetical protein [Acetobacter cibinongensis]|uniref:Uncharacterized protein n=1 Tax=Acetobacter cibinongensis TaxID=146475 RepID=A0A1Z5YW35_9PROT|nr:hypothetical protein [Acetobacter cibinongensis]OUJ03174.1 hypothetical protein HK14_03140 [Acetobacter cibinongensis]
MIRIAIPDEAKVREVAALWSYSALLFNCADQFRAMARKCTKNEEDFWAESFNRTSNFYRNEADLAVKKATAMQGEA